MTNISISLNQENIEYLKTEVQNRSKYINDLIERDRQAKFAELMKQGYLSQSQDPEIQEDDRLWETTVGDGIEKED